MKGIEVSVPTKRVSSIPSGVDAVVPVPGSKSIANRALVCATLAAGESRLANVPDGDDTQAMASAVAALGARVDVSGADVTIDGLDGKVPSDVDPLHAGLAGTTSRFLMGLAALGSGPVIIDGDPPLRQRPFGPLQDALSTLGVAVRPAEGWGTLPVTVHGPPRRGVTELPGDVSSQFVSALMMIGPYVDNGLEIDLSSELVSRPYVELTAAVMASFGVDDVEIADRSIRVPAGRYLAQDFAIEPDASSASYPLAIAAVAGGSLTVPGLGASSWQGDAECARVLEQMGCTVTQTDDSTTVRRDVGVPLRGIDIDMADISDLVPTIAAVACFADGPTRIRGVGFIRAKESDRLGDLAAELTRLGADVAPTADGLTVRPTGRALGGARLATHHDHRLAMAFAVVGSVVPGVVIEHPDVVRKSWPDFWAMYDRLAHDGS